MAGFTGASPHFSSGRRWAGIVVSLSRNMGSAQLAGSAPDPTRAAGADGDLSCQLHRCFLLSTAAARFGLFQRSMVQ
jgi:hypothetical protein